jgi:Putative ATP-dependent DNA helicase recG C-terminal
MNDEERAPPFGRFHPLGDSVVQVLVDIRCGDWVYWGSTHFSLCVREGFVEDDIDVIKPWKLGNVLKARRRRDIDNRKHQKQNESVFPSYTHGRPRAARARLHAARCVSTRDTRPCSRLKARVPLGRAKGVLPSTGNSLIEIDRIIDERRSRNEKLASTMRGLGLCEERGGGLDKAIIEIEDKNLPPPEFHSSKDSMRVVLHGPKAFSKLSKTEKMRACYFHCVIRWLKNDYMSNTTLRGRFRLSAEEYQSVSNIISASVKAKRIAQAEPNQGKRNAKYVPYWARKSSRRTENA